MKLFKCGNCGQVLFFENSLCECCGYELGFNVNQLELTALVKQDENCYKVYGDMSGAKFRYCINHQYKVCNWLVSENDPSPFCKACSFNRTIPDINNPDYRYRWNTIENAKHRLIYSLLRLQLPLVNKITDPIKGLSFDFKADDINAHERILTGHNNGLITLNIAEADDIEREMTRKSMQEVYRTVLGHFRHEIGHYYWEILVASTVHLNQFRTLFGDDRINYAQALNNHYKFGPPTDWNKEFISAYAAMHPWEDWAETWAHYMHIIDTLEMASSFGLSVQPTVASNSPYLSANINIDPYNCQDFNHILALWYPLTTALNSLNRSMGLADPYPFVIPAKAVEKLLFIHNLCCNSKV